jgi:AraC-like DNA-binding protein
VQRGNERIVLISLSAIPRVTLGDGPVSPLNVVWRSELRQRITLPQLGHLMLMFPLGDTAFVCSGLTIDASRYVWLTPTPNHQPVTLDILDPHIDQVPLCVLWLSPPFIAEMARFLNIPDNMQQLLHGLPLVQGDQMSAIVAQLASACRSRLTPEIIEDLFLEVVGEVLRLMRLRHQALQYLAKHKHDTIADLLPRLLLARQFVEACYAQELRTQDVANHVGLSEFHFARLFKAAFDITLRQHIIHLRLDTARRLLELPGSTVTETALHVGYGSLSSFIHAFSKRFGLAPAQYRALAKSEQDLTSVQTV